MSLLENIAEGFGRAANASGVVSDIEKKKAERTDLSHLELQTKADQILGDVKQLQARRASLDPKSPTYQQDVSAIDKSLGDHQQAFTDIFHPVKNPTAFQNLGRYLQKHITGKAPAPLPASNEVTPGRMKELVAGAAGTGQTPPNPYLVKRDQMQAVGVPQDEATRLATGQKDPTENWIPSNVKFADGREVTLQRNSKSGEWTDLAGNPVPKEALSGATIAPKAGAGGGSKFSQEVGVYEAKWGKKIKDWTPEELSYFNQKMAYDSQHAGMTTGTRLEKDADGNIVPVTFTNVHGPMRAPVDPHGVPSTPAAAKQRAASVAPSGPRASAGGVTVGAPLPFKAMTPAINKANVDLNEAVKLSSIADQVAQHPNDAINQKRLAVALERASAGRFTTQALDYIIKAGWGNTIEQWANSTTTGALPKDVLRQLIDGAHQQKIAAQAALDNAKGNHDGGGPAPNKKHRIKVGNLTYEYKGSGNTADMANYTQVQ